MDKEDKEEDKKQETPQEAEPSNRSRVYDRLKGRYPEIDADDEEAVMGRINDDYDESFLICSLETLRVLRS